METIFTNTENRKTNESNKNIGLLNLSICYRWKNIKSQYHNKKLSISAPTWNDEFDLPDHSSSICDIQDYSQKTGNSD